MAPTVAADNDVRVVKLPSGKPQVRRIEVDVSDIAAEAHLDSSTDRLIIERLNVVSAMDQSSLSQPMQRNQVDGSFVAYRQGDPYNFSPATKSLLSICSPRL